MKHQTLLTGRKKWEKKRKTNKQKEIKSRNSELLIFLPCLYFFFTSLKPLRAPVLLVMQEHGCSSLQGYFQRTEARCSPVSQRSLHSYSHTHPCSYVLILLSWKCIANLSMVLTRSDPKRKISNALFNLVNNLFSQYFKKGWTGPCSDLCPSLILPPCSMQLNKITQLQGNQIQKVWMVYSLPKAKIIYICFGTLPWITLIFPFFRYFLFLSINSILPWLNSIHSSCIWKLLRWGF